ncbi:MAG TPA: efflux RND transporter periplasmic adaptor subunit, partial [Gemmataceae bacterium]|nr:efflux RND transporter periplasmic adaptor subunit [Gemmataceae bacterium]
LRSKQLEFARLKTQDPHAELNGLQAQVRQADAALAQAREALKQYALVAPAAGIVLQITVREGDTVGGPSPVPAIQFCPAGPRVVKADVDQASASLVAVGQRVTIEDDAHGPGRWTGKVTWIADWFTNPRPVLVPDPGQYSDVRGMPCIIELDANQRSLKLNQRVLATIDVSPKSR